MDTPHPIVIPVSDSETQALLYRASGAAAVLWSGGWRGGDAPDGLADDVARMMLERGVSSLLLRYRTPYELPSCVADALAAVKYLEGEGIGRVAMVGHSFGGAVVISAAPRSERVVAVAALASQTYGATGAAQVSPRPLLLVHGTADERLAPYCSEQIYSWARQPKELRFIHGASHGLGEARGELAPMLAEWLGGKLGVGQGRCAPTRRRCGRRGRR